MVVQHNLTAMNSNRMLGLTTSSQAKSTEKLSSGYKINRAADDAAGLAISEKMRSQVRGLTQASANAQDGISAVQTAEGALTEVHDMLQRMNELAIKAGNGTMSEDDRQSVQDEIDQLVTEIDRVSETTKFNETYLLKGEGKGDKIDEVSAKVDGKIQDAVITEAKGNIFEGVLATANDGGEDISLAAGTEDTATIEYKDEEGNVRTKDVTFKTGSDAKSTAENLAEAINKDDTLKQIFKASASAGGKISVESKLDGTKTDNTKNAVTDITFESELKEDKSAVGGAKRMNAFKANSEKHIVATGEAYSFAVGKVNTDGSFEFKMQDGESITINGKTYTYDANKADSAANSFKTLEDLQKLIGDEYEINLQLTGKKITTTYTRSDTSGTQADNDAPTVGEPVTENIVANLTDKSKFADATKTDFDTTEDLADSTDTAPAKNSDVGTYNVTLPATKDLKKYTDMQLTLTIAEKSTTEKPSDVLNFSLQVGADTTEENKISVDIQSMSAKSLGIDKVSVTGKDSTNADKAVNTIADAIAQVSKQRSALGAIQNRLEHTINNLDNVVENTTAAESAIRDTDMAEEMVRYSNNSILQQAGQSMLAQANQSNQGVLSLLG